VSRILLQALIPFLLPFAAWLLWWLVTRRGRRLVESTPWYALTVAGLVAMCASLIALAFMGGHAPGRYTPPRLEGDVVLPAVIETVRHEQR
jgi:hypothetical protein